MTAVKRSPTSPCCSSSTWLAAVHATRCVRPASFHNLAKNLATKHQLRTRLNVASSGRRAFNKKSVTLGCSSDDTNGDDDSNGEAGSSDSGDGKEEKKGIRNNDVETFRSQLISLHGEELESTNPSAGADTPAERPKPSFMTRKPRYLSFEEGRKWARAMGMASIDEWHDWAYNGRRNSYIPREPEDAYPDQFVSWDDWLGVVHFMPFADAREYVRALNLTSIQDWFEVCREDEVPAEIPRQPNYIYREEGWVSYIDWLGIDETEPPIRSG
eukprot:CAMPEP_0198206802 /NCGR_PEP_ID=MMETSP1445-20131203/10340_1 /TAXON_ID=36898 /ORGANISM="Pyramimonas sp., Strain CCMP2087" /LENGTH=270 /DNA_ID=CAMNT_0043879645 /DNA_START=290 /DNA_END=1105 /DNA_ORIENTATION=-